MVRLILQHGLGRAEAMLVSLLADMRALGAALFGLTDTELLAVPWPAPAVVLVLVALGCLAVLRARVRAVEIVT